MGDVDTRRICIQGTYPNDRVEVPETAFEGVMDMLSMRQMAYEPGSRRLRPHTVRAPMLIQRLDRLQQRVADAARDQPDLLSTAQGMRAVAEMSDDVSWDAA